MIARFATLAMLALPPAAFAHRLDECLQATLVVIEPARISLKLNLTPGVAVAEEMLARIDGDRDGAISETEAAAYAEAVKGDLSVLLDQGGIDLKLVGSDFPEVSELRKGEGTIRLVFAAEPLRISAGTHTLAFRNRHLPGLSVYLLNAAKPKTEAVRIVAQRRERGLHAGTIEFVIKAP